LTDIKEDFTQLIGLRDRDLRLEGLFVAEGRLLVERALSSCCEVIGIYADESASDEALSIAASRAPVAVCSGVELNRVAGFPFHRGMLALVKRPVIRSAGAIFEKLTGSFFPPNFKALVLPSITDPGNLGTLLRSALAFDYRTVFIGERSCDPFNRKALRASMGASLILDLRESKAEDLDGLRTRGVSVLAAAMEDSASIAGFETDRKFGAHALVLGNEYSGIDSDWRSKCSLAIQIPVSDAVDSLNVAVAGSILMWELNRRTLP
jgi:tRNA G18 (ribose-2'-O)-methylase SpoU